MNFPISKRANYPTLKGFLLTKLQDIFNDTTENPDIIRKLLLELLKPGSG